MKNNISSCQAKKRMTNICIQRQPSEDKWLRMWAVEKNIQMETKVRMQSQIMPILLTLEVYLNLILSDHRYMICNIVAPIQCTSKMLHTIRTITLVECQKRVAVLVWVYMLL